MRSRCPGCALGSSGTVALQGTVPDYGCLFFSTHRGHHLRSYIARDVAIIHRLTPNTRFQLIRCPSATQSDMKHRVWKTYSTFLSLLISFA